MKSRTRAILAAAATVAVALVTTTLPLSLQPTSAAWTDRVNTTGSVSAGTWGSQSALACAPVDPAVKATCTVTATTWSNWGAGYRMGFDITTTSATAFEWTVSVNLAATGSPAPGGGTYFPGVPVPSPGAWQPAWTPSKFSFTNICSVGTSSALPTMKVKGSASWDRLVSASAPVTSIGFQTTASGGSTLESLAC